MTTQTAIRVKLELTRESKGAVLYNEVDADNKPVDMREGTLGSVYIRKTALAEMGYKGSYPTNLFITVEAD